LNEAEHLPLLNASCELHEIGLLLSFKEHQQHGCYILQHADLPGFDQAEQQFLATFVKLYKGDIKVKLLQQLSTVNYQTACYLLVILRLANILSRRRKDDVLPQYQTKIEGNNVHLCLPETWLTQHPLIADELTQENKQLEKLNLHLNIYCPT
jgi:exopolyphosphatase/guanosine-5'-triphosphate,3'-diphosphate pyrophosphatase